jgi:hypothetical protein
LKNKAEDKQIENEFLVVGQEKLQKGRGNFWVKK